MLLEKQSGCGARSWKWNQKPSFVQFCLSYLPTIQTILQFVDYQSTCLYTDRRWYHRLSNRFAVTERLFLHQSSSNFTPYPDEFLYLAQPSPQKLCLLTSICDEIFTRIAVEMTLWQYVKLFGFEGPRVCL